MKQLIITAFMLFTHSSFAAEFYYQRCSNSSATVQLRASADSAYRIDLLDGTEKIQHFAKIRSNEIVSVIESNEKKECAEGKSVGFLQTKKVYVSRITLENDDSSDFPFGISGLTTDQKE